MAKSEVPPEVPADTKPVSKSPRDWAQEKALGTNLASRMAFDIATLLGKWPNADLDPTFEITEIEFDAAIEAARKL